MKMFAGTATAVAGALGALALSMSAPTVAQAYTYLGGCSNTDVSPTAGDCYGYFQGNANGNSADNQAAQTVALGDLGLSGPYTQVEHLDFGEGASIIDFVNSLSGPTYISIHWGAGQGPVKTQGGTTGFYRLDLASDAELDTITSNWGSLSNAVLWSTDGGVVPEPATWAMMIVGFGGVGAVVRRRRSALANA